VSYLVLDPEREFVSAHSVKVYANERLATLPSDAVIVDEAGAVLAWNARPISGWLPNEGGGSWQPSVAGE
jgi:hypothetical protein